MLSEDIAGANHDDDDESFLYHSSPARNASSSHPLRLLLEVGTGSTDADAASPYGAEGGADGVVPSSLDAKPSQSQRVDAKPSPEKKRGGGGPKSSIVICYSGQQRGFGVGPYEGNGAGVATNHVEYLLAPLRHGRSEFGDFGGGGGKRKRTSRPAWRGFDYVDVAFSLTDGEAVPRAAVELYSKYATTIVADDLDPRETRLSLDRAGHPQYAGIRHCGSLIDALERRHRRAFDFAIRMRYDFLFRLPEE